MSTTKTSVFETVDHVLVSSAGNGTKRRYHRPDPDDPTKPHCGTSLYADYAEWYQKTHPRQITFYEQCTQCDWRASAKTRTCETCGQVFPTRRSLNGHRRRGGGDCPEEA